MEQPAFKHKQRQENSYLNMVHGFKFFQDLFLRAPVGYLVLSTRGFVQAVNGTAARLLRVEPTNLISTYLPRLNPPMGLKTLANHFEGAVDSLLPRSCIVVCTWPNRTRRRLQVVSQCLRDSDGYWGLRTILIEIDLLENWGLHSVPKETRPKPGQRQTSRISTLSSVRAPAGKDNNPQGRKHALLVDDDQAVRDVYTIMLEFLGYRVTKCRNGGEALTVFMRDPSSYHILLTDLDMPGMFGSELAAKVRKVRPDIPVILLTGHMGRNTGKILESGNVDKILSKPVSLIGLERAIDDVLS